MIEPAQLVVSAATAGYAFFALRTNDPLHNRWSRYLLVAFGVFGAIVVLGLSADRSSSRTWARLGWAALIFGYVGSIVAWIGIRKYRLATVTAAIVGLVIIGSGVGLTLNCDLSIQRSWCNPDFEREQTLAEQIEIDGQLERSGRTSGSLGPAMVSYFVADGASIADVTDPPGEWRYEEQPTQSIEIDRGRFTTDVGEYSDCRLDVKIETVPAGNRQSVFVSCGASS